jgi:murein DD-endopeptidase MepM/ murein hydrolase activator NlpD
MRQDESVRALPRSVEPLLGILSACVLLAACDQTTAPERAVRIEVEPAADHVPGPQSVGIYRIPYADGTVVDVWQDHHTHSPARDRIDLAAGQGAVIVAAASGWIRFLRDHHGDSFGRGDGLAADSVTPQNDALEHACLNNNPVDPGDPPNPIVGGCGAHNNYVWIEHPNGEWTKYTHFATGTVQIDNGWAVGDWVNAGEVLGLEDDIGAARGSPAFHLHFEVARPNDPNASTLPITGINGGFIDTGLAFNMVPRNCDDAGNIFLYDVANDGLVANPCDNAPPTADAAGPYVVNEGAPLMLDGTGSSDPDGRPLTFRWEPSDNLDDASLAQPTFTAGNNGIYNVTLTVYDQMEALWDSDVALITVSNVAPTVTIDAAQVTEIDEHGIVTVVAEFTDPGFLDTHTATVDWGVPAGHAGVETVPPSIQVLEAGGPGVPLRGRVTATYRYGDDDDGNGYRIEVTVTDSDDAEGQASFDLAVNNRDPVPAIDPSGTVLLNGVPTIVANAGDEVDFAGMVTDPGSDDLTITWDWGDGSTTSRVSLVNPPAVDPLPSPTVQPRSEPEETAHTFASACMFEVSLEATDDDGGEGSAAIDVLIAGNADVSQGSGYWTSEYRKTKNADFTTATLDCYLAIVNHASQVFSEHRSIASHADAIDVLWTRGTSSPDDLFDSQLLALWLNFANGAYALDQLVDTNDDGVPDSFFSNVLVAAENLRTNPARTAADVLARKDLLESLNLGN